MKEITPEVEKLIRRNIKEAFEHTSARKGRNYVIYRGEMYFNSGDLARTIFRTYEKGGVIAWRELIS